MMRFTCISLFAVFALAFAAADADEPILGTTVLARTKPTALVIWDCAPKIVELVKNKASDSDANSQLEKDALLIAIKMSPQVPDAKSLTVRVVYSKTGDVNPAYGEATFAGIEHYAEVTLTRKQINDDADRWKEAANGSGMIPAFIQLKITGELPPRS